ncbi:hypothetical protein [Serratia sp. (in: enterobacteria)]|uniref:hypothetical protein n=1 Tax=Serratia sp. (in: enterobacteria) TaxID=616 RepID=UPI0040376A09
MDVGFMRPLLVWRGYWIDGENVMSGFKGTPGPWELMKDDDELKVIQAGSLEKGFGWKSYCNVCENVSGDANAKLIAAAPELLEALQETVKDLVAYQVKARNAARINNRWEGVSEAVQASIYKAREAINKALGS